MINIFSSPAEIRKDRVFAMIRPAVADVVMKDSYGTLDHLFPDVREPGYELVIDIIRANFVRCEAKENKYITMERRPVPTQHVDRTIHYVNAANPSHRILIRSDSLTDGPDEDFQENFLGVWSGRSFTSEDQRFANTLYLYQAEELKQLLAQHAERVAKVAKQRIAFLDKHLATKK